MPLGDFLIEWLRRLTNTTTTSGKELAAAAQTLGLPFNEAVARALVNLSLRWINGEELTASMEDLIQE